VPGKYFWLFLASAATSWPLLAGEGIGNDREIQMDCVPEHSSWRSIVSLETSLEAVADRKQFAFGDDTGLRLFRPTEASGGGFDAGDLAEEAREFQAVREMAATR
jgi:hypothetical protein